MPKKPNLLLINLLPSREEGFGEKFLAWSLTFGRYIIIGTEIIVLVAFFSRFKLDRDLIDLNDKVKEKQSILATLAPVEEAVNHLQTRFSEIRTIENAQSSGISVLASLAAFTPSEVTYKTISVSGNKVTIVGNAANSADISRFTALLASSNLFKKESVVLEKVERTKPEDEFISFTVTAVVEKGT